MTVSTRDVLLALGVLAAGGAVTVLVRAWQQVRRDDLLLAAIAAGLPTVVKPSDARLVAFLRALRNAAPPARPDRRHDEQEASA